MQFRKCTYSIDPRYIGCEVNLEVLEVEDQVKIYYSGEEVRAHELTIQLFNYYQDDMRNILTSDVLKCCSVDEIEQYLEASLKTI
ncbi:hypothetical protein P7H29_10800 [Enterococcus pseudoavium]|nr:hypothetical protein [Enterococcus pseudoavium]MDT2755352.1 hypothetical protein [Enterococcus pseudoavium]